MADAAPSKSSIVRVAFAFALAISALFPATALATITIDTAHVHRTIADHKPTMPYYNYISRADCEGKDAFEIPYTGANFSGLQLEVWATGNGADCSTQLARSGGSGSLQCVRLSTIEMPKATGDMVVITARELAQVVDSVTPGTCEDTNTSSAARDLAIWFLLTNGSSGDLDMDHFSKFGDAKVDLRGPSPPTDLMTNGIENGVTITYMLSPSNDVAGYFIFCDPMAGAATGSGGTGGSGGAGGSASTSAEVCRDVMSSTSSSTTSSTTSTTSAASTTVASSSSASSTVATTASATSGAGGGGMGGMGGTSSSTTSATVGTSTSASVTSVAAVTSADASSGSGGDTQCVSSVLVAGQIPPCAYVCGIASTSGGGQAKNLVNGSKYVVGVAGFDHVDNVGPLSELACGTPIEVDDFFELYKDAGGTGGGCGCNLAERSNALGAGILTGLVAYAAVRRRRRRTR